MQLNSNAGISMLVVTYTGSYAGSIKTKHNFCIRNATTTGVELYTCRAVISISQLLTKRSGDNYFLSVNALRYIKFNQWYYKILLMPPF